MRNHRSASITLLASLALAAAACTDAGDTADEGYWDDRTGMEVDDGTGATGPTPTPAPDMRTTEPQESMENFVNPERGFYTGYDLLSGRDASSIRTNGYSLAIAIVDLSAYRDAALPSSLLSSLDAGFERARAAGIKLIVRFTYGSVSDASEARILGHIHQVTPALRDNADVIATVQAGFIGRWGEWHSSTHGLDNDETRADIITALLDAVPASRSVALRKPSFKRNFAGEPLAAAEAFGDSPRARLGHHNDCFLASATDLGTYDSPIADSMAYVAADTTYAPMGGETCAVYAPRSSCSNAVAELASHHWSYLNRMYNAAVINGWVSEGCDSTIRRLLGYRFVARRVAVSESVAPGGVLAVELDVLNRGYAVPMNERPLEVVLTSGGVRKVARLSYDARRIAAGATTTISARLRVPADLAPGTYSVALRLPDASASLAGDARYAIRLANEGTWNESTGDNLLTDALVVDTAAGGERDASATTFAQLN
jgi:hypothetical protein